MHRDIQVYITFVYKICALCNLSANASIPRNDENIIISYHHIIIFITVAREYHDTRRASPTYIVIRISDANGRVRIVYIILTVETGHLRLLNHVRFTIKKKERLPT